MEQSKAAEPTDTKQAEHRSRFTVARALLLGSLSLGSLVGAAAAASADPDPSGPIIDGYSATCNYTTGGTARPIITAARGGGDTDQHAIDDAKRQMLGNPLSPDCSVDEQDPDEQDQSAPNVADAFNNARSQNNDTSDDTTGGSYHQRHNNPGH